METFYIQNIKEIRSRKSYLEEKLKIKITIKGRNVIIEGEPIKEYEAELIFNALKLGFSVDKSVLLQNEEMIFRVLNIKDHTKKKNLEEVRGRIIGKNGKTKNTIEEISGCFLSIQDNTIGVIGPSEEIEIATTALTNLIKGSKQTNIYKFLEKMNKNKRIEDLGLKK